MRLSFVKRALFASALVAFAGCSSSVDTSSSNDTSAVSGDVTTTVSVTDTADTTATAEPITSDETTTTVSAEGTVRISVTVGVDSGKDRVEEIPLGSQVELSFTNPVVADEYHVHGYDLGGGETAKGETKTFTFTADKAGDFDVESHATEDVLVVLRVS